MTMNAVRVTCFISVLAYSYAQMSRKDLRSSIANINPVFAHQRDSPMPVSQNTNIAVPADSISPAEAAAAVATEELRSSISKINPVFAHTRNSPMPVSQNTNIVLPADSISPAKAATAADSRIAPSPKEPTPINTPQSKMSKAPNGAVVAARKNVKVRPFVHARVQPQTATPQTTKAATTSTTKKPVQQSMQSNQVSHEAVKHIPDVETTETNPNECSFKIPYPGRSSTRPSDQCPTHLFVGRRNVSPNLFISILENRTNTPLTWRFLNLIRNRINSNEFDKKCLLPAFRARTLGVDACRSREVTVYLQWLMYLRSEVNRM